MHPFHVQFRVAFTAFQHFIEVAQGFEADPTTENYQDMIVLAKRFRFTMLTRRTELAHFQQTRADPKPGLSEDPHDPTIDLDHLPCAQSKFSDMLRSETSRDDLIGG
jgi:hypothetical protein